MVSYFKLCFISFVLSALAFEARAEQAFPISCLPEATSLQAFEVWSSDLPLKKVYTLKTQKFDRIKSTGVVVSVQRVPEKQSLELIFSFSNPDALSLPFNLYAVMVSNSRGEVVWRDLTASCIDPGISFFPGQDVEIEPIQLEINEGESYRLMIWGRI